MVNVQYEQTQFVNRETDGSAKRENREAGGEEGFCRSYFARMYFRNKNILPYSI